jgi:ATP-dependent RNA helicase MSS116, mitochondrial
LVVAYFMRYRFVVLMILGSVLRFIHGYGSMQVGSSRRFVSLVHSRRVPLTLAAEGAGRGKRKSSGGSGASASVGKRLIRIKRNPDSEQKKGERVAPKEISNDGRYVTMQPGSDEDVEAADMGDSQAAAEGARAYNQFSNEKFADLDINPAVRRALAETLGYEFMTPVQSETLPPIMQGKDCLAKAKTGTGKTLGFLIPTIEKVIGLRRASADVIPVLILSPSRELASQIAKEAEILLTFMPQMKTVTMFGGTNINKDFNHLKGRVDILVATPGRLLDHLQNHNLKHRLDNINVLIMDEADQLLDMGFRPDIERILNLLSMSKPTRQTLLFSATVPKSVKEIARMSLRTGYSLVDTVGEEEEQTHKHVKQEIVVTGNDALVVHMAAVLDAHMQQEANAKVMVFFCTARLTQSMALLFKSMGYPVEQIHSRLSQSARTKISDRFKTSRSGILFSSDVSARGMDYPDVTFVLQVGLVEREQYIHRLGRTARAGKTGGGMIILAPYEEREMRRALQDMPLQTTTPMLTPDLLTKVSTALSRVPGNEELKAATEQAYRAWMGYYNGNLRKCGWDKPTLVREANKIAGFLGLAQQPSLQKKTIGKMGLKGVPGLIIEKQEGEVRKGERKKVTRGHPQTRSGRS